MWFWKTAKFEYCLANILGISGISGKKKWENHHGDPNNLFYNKIKGHKVAIQFAGQQGKKLLNFLGPIESRESETSMCPNAIWIGGVS